MQLRPSEFTTATVVWECKWWEWKNPQLLRKHPWLHEIFPWLRLNLLKRIRHCTLECRHVNWPPLAQHVTQTPTALPVWECQAYDLVIDHRFFKHFCTLCRLLSRGSYDHISWSLLDLLVVVLLSPFSRLIDILPPIFGCWFWLAFPKDAGYLLPVDVLSPSKWTHSESCSSARHAVSSRTGTWGKQA